MIEKEIRKISDNITAEQDSRTITGYAILFNTKSQLLDGWFYEIISPDAVDENTIARSDVFGLLNHDNERGILSRSKYGKGTLTLSVDDKGLFYSFESPHTALGDEVLEHLRLKNITASSFCFSVDDEEKVKNADETYTRTIKKIDFLYDISPVYSPAYAETTSECCSKRMLDFKTSIESEEKRKLDELEIEKKELEKKELEIYFDSLKNKFKK